jgi:hypothetical protein
MRRILILAFLLRGVFEIQAQCLEGNCKNGFGTFYSQKKGVKYSGILKNKTPNGQGTAYYRNGRIYAGDWSMGTWHGKGTVSLPDGTSLTGLWVRNKLKNLEVYKSENPIQLATEDQSLVEVTTSNPNVEVVNQQAPAPTPERVKPPIRSRNANSYNETTESLLPTSEIWAVAIGIAAYDNPSIPSLKYPDNDAFSIYSFWKSPLGGSLDDDHSQVLVDDGATKAMIMHSMRSTFYKAKEQDLAIFFFSGHGLKGSFLPSDYDGDDIRLYHNEVSKVLSECRAKHKLVIADACHSGSYVAGKGVTGKPTKALAQTFYDELGKSDAGVAYLLSSQADEESLEVSTLRNSVFTYFVVKGLKGEANANNDNIITIQELFDYVYLNVTSYANKLGKIQTPLIKGDYDPNMPVAVVRN